MGGRFTDTPEFLDEEGDAMALGLGLGHGFRRVNPKPDHSVAVEKNRFYYYPGYIIGYVLKVCCLAVLFRIDVQVP
jgi:hypothetical protein